jgi:hypothetical protein
MVVGRDGDLFAGSSTFIISSINNSADIQKIYLRVNISNMVGGWGTSSILNISRLNGVCINSSTTNGYNTVLSASEYKIVNGLGKGPIDIDLGDVAVADLESQLEFGCFSVGFAAGQYGADPTNMEIQTSESTFPPELHVVFEGDFNYCDTPPFGDFSCNRTCTYINQEVKVPENLHVYDSCTLGLAGNTNMSFLGINSSIYVYKQGMVWINDTAGFNKK